MAARSTTKADEGIVPVDASTADSIGTEAPNTEAEKPGAVEEKDSGHEYLNTTSSPLVFTKDGHLVGSGEWTPSITLDAFGKRARDRGYLKPRSAL